MADAVRRRGRGAGGTELIDPASGERIAVPAEANELVDCSARWCRVRVLRSRGVLWQDVMRPDGSNRRRVVTGGETEPAVYDVAVRGRYELLATPMGSGSTLVAYDAVKRRQIKLADGAGTVLCRGSYAWWSSGTNDALSWHVTDLTAL
ncbi:MAG: hypothetical protein ACRDTM_04785 [Micromonosporaceae bacterium]